MGHVLAFHYGFVRRAKPATPNKCLSQDSCSSVLMHDCVRAEGSRTWTACTAARLCRHPGLLRCSHNDVVRPLALQDLACTVQEDRTRRCYRQGSSDRRFGVLRVDCTRHPGWAAETVPLLQVYAAVNCWWCRTALPWAESTASSEKRAAKPAEGVLRFLAQPPRRPRPRRASPAVFIAAWRPSDPQHQHRAWPVPRSSIPALLAALEGLRRVN
jgi:hypothetical protein